MVFDYGAVFLYDSGMKKLIILLGVLGVSLSAPLIRLSDAPAMVLALYRVALAALLLLPWVLIRRRRELLGLGLRELCLCLLAGLFLGLHFACYFQALRYTGIASAVVLVDTEVFFVALLLPLLFRERVSPLGWLGILVTFGGSVLIAAADAAGGGNVLLGDLIALAGAACMAGYTLLGRACRRKLSTAVYTFLVYLSAAVTLLLIALLTGTPLGGYRPVNLLTALGMAVFCTLLGHSVFSWGLRYESPAFISTVKLLEPVFAAVLGVLLFREIPRLPVILGGAVVILGVFLYTRYGEKKGT